MKYKRLIIEKESPEEYGYDRIRYNLSESSIRDLSLADFNLTIPNLTLLYGEHRGDLRLRESIASQAENISPNDVLVTTGAAGALFIVSTTLLNPGDHLVVMRPNYATNIETPRGIGCEISFVDLDFNDGFRLDLDKVKASIRPNTRLISVTCPHNPSGTMISRVELDGLIALAETNGCRLLVDETYRDLTHAEWLPVAAGLSNRVISVSSLSKAYGIPGVRTGWLIIRDAALYENFLAAKEQINICGSIIDEWISASVLEQRHQFLADLHVETLKRLTIVRDWVASDPLIEWVEPKGGVVCVPRIVSSINLDMGAFYKRLLETHGTYVGGGHWFEMPKTYFRIGYMWPTADQLRRGLAAISNTVRELS